MSNISLTGYTGGTGSSGDPNVVTSQNRSLYLGSRVPVIGTNNAIMGTDAGLNMTEGDCNVILGTDAARNMTSGSNNVLIGHYVHPRYLLGDGNISIGANVSTTPTVDSDNNISIGYLAEARGGCANAFGFNCETTGGNSIVMGCNTNNSGANCIIIGNVITNTSNSIIKVGDLISGDGINYDISFGFSNTVSGGCSNVFGYNSSSTGANSVVIGCNSSNIGTDAIIIGDNITNTTSNVVNIGNFFIGYSSALTVTPETTFSNNVKTTNYLLDDYWKITTADRTDTVVAKDLTFVSLQSKTLVRFEDYFEPGVLCFTGQHRCVMNKSKIPDEEMIGKIVVSDGHYMDYKGNVTIHVDDAIPVVSISKERKDPRVFGVISRILKESGRFKIGCIAMCVPSDDKKRVLINSTGEGGIWVCDRNGPIKNGDYLMTSDIPGLACKQDDDILHNYTVAKITCDCDFVEGNEIDLLNGEFIFTKFVGCIYLC